VDKDERSEAGLQEKDIANVASLVETIRTAPLESVRALSKRLIRLNVPGMFEIMERLLGDDNPDLSLAAYDWLAKSADDRAGKVLLAKLEGPSSSDNERWLAAEALGHRGETDALEAIRRLARRYLAVERDSRLVRTHLVAANLPDSTARLLVRLAVAEAELGGDDLAAIPVALARADTSSGRDPIVRIEAVTALESTVTMGTLESLGDAVLADDDEVVERAIGALQFIGAREAVDTLVEVATPERSALAELALTAIVAITGPGPGMNRSFFDLAPDELSQWWQKERHKFRTGVCYRLGKPMSISTLVEILRDPQQRPYAAHEIHIVTAFDCGYDDDLTSEAQESIVHVAQDWLNAAGAKFKAGVLYKFGYERKLSEVLQPA
jgi:hypothetical protein